MTADATRWVTVVSGLPRSGTSLMMQMLRAAGLPTWTDGARPPDANNPLGYFEHAGLASLLAGPEAMAAALGHAVKVVHPLVLRLPRGVDYRILFMRRDVGEVVASQRAMALRLGAPGPVIDDGRLARYWSEQLRLGVEALRDRDDCRVLEVSFEESIRDPATAAGRVGGFLGLPDAAVAMAGVVRPEFYRSRRDGH